MKISFDLARKTGKNITLRRGNMMISANDRMHYQVKGKITQFLRELACYECKRTGLVPETPYSPSRPCTVAVIVRPPTARRNDAPNWYPTVKALVDGMTDAATASLIVALPKRSRCWKHKASKFYQQRSRGNSEFTQ